jgi:hypothetical protein
MVLWRVCWARRALWGEKLTVSVSFLLQFFFQTPPSKLAHLGLHLSFDLAQ